ncbi:unnamed protein product [Prunus armeniaca]|uniref:Uncharacterized protein n=1 Tax=Prunus armeniaca TaxID=36596 RepID=A0A6J5UF74_PRUAR|nr:unnamed protein product [Prunus armeniaca]
MKEKRFSFSQGLQRRKENRAGGQNGQFTVQKSAQGSRPSLKWGQNHHFTIPKLQSKNSES